MSTEDKSFGFDFLGTYTEIEKYKKIESVLGDNRKIVVTFEQEADGQILVAETFEAETQNPIEMQRAGWQAILGNFRKECEESCLK